MNRKDLLIHYIVERLKVLGETNQHVQEHSMVGSRSSGFLSRGVQGTGNDEFIYQEAQMGEYAYGFYEDQ